MIPKGLLNVLKRILNAIKVMSPPINTFGHKELR